MASYRVEYWPSKYDQVGREDPSKDRPRIPQTCEPSNDETYRRSLGF